MSVRDSSVRPDTLGSEVAFEVNALPNNRAARAASSQDLCARDLESFRKQRLLARRHLPFLRTLTDFDIATEVGFHELAGAPLTVKQLLLLELAPSVTVFRRLDRLCELGVVLRTRSPRDGRVNELRLTPPVQQLFATYCRLNRP